MTAADGGPGTVRGRVRVEPGPKWIRAYLGGELVLSTRTPWLVWEVPFYPAYYVPVEDVRAELAVTEKTEHSPSRGDATIYDVRTSGKTAPAAARRYLSSPIPELREAVRFEWNSMDEWLEEDEPVYVHPRDPYKRVDILASSRRVQVELEGVQLADSVAPRILYETGLPPRYYLPLPDVRRELLRPSTSASSCPYKGTAAYWSVEINGELHEDLVWIYRTPLPESQKIAGLACFYNEKVDISLDGVRQPRPRTQFS
jgi:uncharacterized protein (DUF427 family)